MKTTLEYSIKELYAATGELFIHIAKAFRTDRLMEWIVKIADKHYEKGGATMACSGTKDDKKKGSGGKK